MKLLKVYKNKYKNTQSGFSIIEMLVVVGIVMVVAGITAPVGFRYYQTQLLDESVNLVFDTLRRAQQNSLFQKNDSSFGVSFGANSLILFEGESFVNRNVDEDELFVLSDNVSFDGLEEVVFSKKYGTTTEGVVTVSMNAFDEYIDINAKGRIDKR